MSKNKSTKRGHVRTPSQDPETLIRFADGAQQCGDGIAEAMALGGGPQLLKLRGLSPSTQDEYMRFVRKLTARTGGDPSFIDEATYIALRLWVGRGVPAEPCHLLRNSFSRNTAARSQLGTTF